MDSGQNDRVYLASNIDLQQHRSCQILQLNDRPSIMFPVYASQANPTNTMRTPTNGPSDAAAIPSLQSIETWVWLDRAFLHISQR
jgi:hypothetical protein